jgi:hypothetical protein
MSGIEEKIIGIMDDIAGEAWPADPVIPVAEPFKNASGEIWNLAWAKFESASFIRSVAGSVRSNHYHKTDWHFIFVVSGLMYYYQRDANSNETPLRRRCPPGTLVFTPPFKEHATFFPVATDVVTLQKFQRDHAHHEADLIRVPPFVTTEICPAVFDGVHCTLPWQHVEGRDFRHPIHAGDHEAVDGRTFNFG